jgi:flavin reductase (DIM6/NTAB) family NADH-FMN oxidoreductase RutF
MFDAKELRRIMGQFATGVTILTTRDAAGAVYGLTANAVSSLSLVPPLLLICIDRKAESFPHFLASRVFAMNILSTAQEELSGRFAKSGGDKFAGVSYRLGTLGAPLLDGALAWAECRIVVTHEAGDHVIHVGEVEAADAPGGDPLLFFQGRYRRLAD